MEINREEVKIHFLYNSIRFFGLWWKGEFLGNRESSSWWFQKYWVVSIVNQKPEWKREWEEEKKRRSIGEVYPKGGDSAEIAGQF